MKNKLLILLTLTQLLSSCVAEETAKLDKCLKATINENNCLIALKSTTANKKKCLVLTTQCKSDSILFYGKVLYDFVSNLSREKVYFDTYSITNNSNKELLAFDKNEWTIISSKRQFFDEIVNELQIKNYRKIYDLLSPEIKAQVSYEDMQATIKPSLQPKYSTFEGLTIMSLNGEKYISLSKIIGKHRILITFSLKKSIDTIYGYSW